jgi:hypothetical protein
MNFPSGRVTTRKLHERAAALVEKSWLDRELILLVKDHEGPLLG